MFGRIIGVSGLGATWSSDEFSMTSLFLHLIQELPLSLNRKLSVLVQEHFSQAVKSGIREDEILVDVSLIPLGVLWPFLLYLSPISSHSSSPARSSLSRRLGGSLSAVFRRSHGGGGCSFIRGLHGEGGGNDGGGLGFTFLRGLHGGGGGETGGGGGVGVRGVHGGFSSPSHVSAVSFSSSSLLSCCSSYVGVHSRVAHYPLSSFGGSGVGVDGGGGGGQGPGGGGGQGPGGGGGQGPGGGESPSPHSSFPIRVSAVSFSSSSLLSCYPSDVGVHNRVAHYPLSSFCGSGVGVGGGLAVGGPDGGSWMR